MTINVILASAVGNAVATLTDAEKRKRYDMVGPENSSSDHVHRNYDRGFECKMIFKKLQLFVQH